MFNVQPRSSIFDLNKFYAKINNGIEKSSFAIIINKIEMSVKQ